MMFSPKNGSGLSIRTTSKKTHQNYLHLAPQAAAKRLLGPGFGDIKARRIRFLLLCFVTIPGGCSDHPPLMVTWCRKPSIIFQTIPRASREKFIIPQSTVGTPSQGKYGRNELGHHWAHRQSLRCVFGGTHSSMGEKNQGWECCLK